MCEGQGGNNPAVAKSDLNFDNIPSGALYALDMLSRAGYEAVLIGGCVRDTIMGIKPGDYDIATSAIPAETLEVFSDDRTVPTGLKHGTVTLIKDGMPFEITTYRVDGEYTDMRRPDSVTFTRTLREDVMRRDFTMNALAWMPGRGLIDHVDGVGDISRGIIRTVGDADRRFSEDALRIYRALRFASRLGFAIDKDTSEAARRLADNTKRLAVERVFNEYTGILKGTHRKDIFSGYEDILRRHISCEKNIPHELWQRSAARLGMADGNDITFLWAVLLSSAGADKACEALKYLRCDTQTLRTACGIISASADIDTSRYGLRALAGDESEYIARRALMLALADDPPALEAALGTLGDIISTGQAFPVSGLRLNGTDLKDMGIPPRQIGEYLKRLLDDVRADRIENTAEALMRRVAEIRDSSAI